MLSFPSLTCVVFYSVFENRRVDHKTTTNSTVTMTTEEHKVLTEGITVTS